MATPAGTGQASMDPRNPLSACSGVGFSLPRWMDTMAGVRQVRRMRMSETQSAFEGWAILEIFGHQKYAGFVRTVYYGTACMFQCDVPPLKERERVTISGCYVDFKAFPDPPIESREWAQPGSTVKQPATEGYSKLFGVGAIYALTPCDEKAALKAVEEIQPRPLMLVSLPEGKALTAG